MRRIIRNDTDVVSWLQTVIDDLRWSREELFTQMSARCFIDILPPYPIASGSIRHFRSGSRGCNIMERYCARELGMHGSSEYSRRVNTRTPPGAWEGDRYEEWYELCQARRGGGRYREQICRAEHNWSQKCRECSMVMEDNELDLQSRQKMPSTFSLGRRKNSSGLNLLNWLNVERKTFIYLILLLAQRSM